MGNLSLHSKRFAKQKYVSVSRPRRFGKTMAADMICAYYDREADSRELFAKRRLAWCEPVRVAGREIAWDGYLGKFDVIRIVMTRFFEKRAPVSKALSKMQMLVGRDIRKKYPDVDYFDEGDLVQIIEDAYSANGVGLVVVIDEWDAVFRECRDDGEGQKEYLDFLRKLLKDNRYMALAYMAGILPIKKYGRHSALNMFTEYSMMFPRQLARFTGWHITLRRRTTPKSLNSTAARDTLISHICRCGNTRRYRRCLWN